MSESFNKNNNNTNYNTNDINNSYGNDTINGLMEKFLKKAKRINETDLTSLSGIKELVKTSAEDTFKPLGYVYDKAVDFYSNKKSEDIKKLRERLRLETNPEIETDLTIKQGTKGTIKYKNNNGELQQIILNGTENITEDKNNIYIINNNNIKTTLPKQYTKKETLKDIYTEDELEQLRSSIFRPMTDEEWQDEINKTREVNYRINSLLTKQKENLEKALPMEMINQIKDMEPMGIGEYIYATNAIKEATPIIQQAYLKIKDGKEITQEEYDAIMDDKFFRYNINTRGITWGDEVFSGVILNLQENLEATMASLLTDAALMVTGGGLLKGVSKLPAMTKAMSKFLSIAKNYPKTTKALKYGSKFLGMVGADMVRAKIDTVSRTHVFDGLLSDSRDFKIQQAKNERILALTDLGGLNIKELSQEDEDFIEYQIDSRYYAEAFSERFTERALRLFLSPFHVPEAVTMGIVEATGAQKFAMKFANSSIGKGLKYVNELPKVVLPKIGSTTFDDLLTEHLEEQVSTGVVYLLGANDPDTTLAETLQEYFEPENFLTSTLSIMIAGGIIKGVSNTFTDTKEPLESINRKVVKNYFKKKFDKNPEMTFNDYIDKDNYESKIDVLDERKIEELATDIYRAEDNKSQEVYNKKMEELKQDLININITEAEADKYLKVINSIYSSLAFNMGVSRYDVANRIRLKVQEIRENINGNALFQSAAMYRAPQNNIKDFVDDVLNNNLEKKKYFEYRTNNNISIEITSDTINHDLKRHNLKSKEWEDILYSLDNILDAKENYKPNYFGNNNIVLLTHGKNNKYNIVITQTNGRNKITTAFVPNDKKAGLLSPEPSFNSSLTSTTSTGSVSGLDDIINKLKSKVNSETITPNRPLDISPQEGLGGDTFYQTAYHGSPYTFDKFTLDHIGEGEGVQAHGWGLYFALDRNTAERYKSKLHKDILKIVEQYNENKINTKEYEKIKNEFGLEYANKDFIDFIEYFKNFITKYKKDLYRIKKGLKDEYNIDAMDVLKKIGYKNTIKIHYSDQKLNKEILFNEILKDFKENDKSYIHDKLVDIRGLNYDIKEFDTKRKNKYNNITYEEIQNKIDIINELSKNKLYKVDIPEDDVMLREDAGFNKQPEEVKKALNKILEDKTVNMEIREMIALFKDNEAFDEEVYTAGSLYENICEEFINILDDRNRSQRETSLLLNKYGVKGIRYNGQTDGECAVVFDDKAIDILDTYYQAINNNLNLNQPVEILSIKNLLKNNKNTTKADAKKVIQQIAESGEQIETLSEPWVMDIINNSYKKKHLLNSSLSQKFDNKQYNRHNIELNNLKDIINNSVLVERVDNIKETKKPNVEEYFYFYTPITDGKNIYLIKLVAEKLKGENDLKNVHLYDMFDYQIKGRVNPIFKPDNTTSAPSSTISIKDILQNVKDFYGNNALDAYIAENQDTLLQNNNSNKKGFIELGNTKAIINLISGKYDQSTVLHELAHYYLKLIEEFDKEGYPIAKIMLDEVKEFTTTFDNKIGTQTHERFARAFEQYVRSGKSKNNNLKGVFDYFKSFLESIYKTSSELGIDNPKVYEFFDKYLYHPERYNNWVYGDEDDDDEKEELNDMNNTVDLVILKQDTINEELRQKMEQKKQEITNRLAEETGLKAEIDRRIEELRQEQTPEERIIDIAQTEFAVKIAEIHKKALELTENELKKEQQTEQNEYIKNLRQIKNSFNRYEKELQQPSQQSQSVSDYKKQKQNNYIQKYNRHYSELLDQEFKDENNDYLTNFKEKRKSIDNFINKIFAEYIVEEDTYIKEVFKRVNDERRKIMMEAQRGGMDVDIKPYRSVEEMLKDYEERNKGNDYFERVKDNNKIKRTNEKGGSISDYELTLDEYENIVNFRKRYLKRKIDEMENEMIVQNNKNKELENQINEREKDRKRQQELIDKYKAQLEDYEKLEAIAGTDIKTLGEVEQSMGFIRDLTLRNKILKYSGTNRNPEYVKKKIQEYKQKEVKKDYQLMIDNVLKGTTSISKRTGKEYGNVIYEDSGLFKELKRIVKLSKKKAEREYIELENNEESKKYPKQHELKKELLYFRMEDNIDTKLMNEILTNLGNYARESEKELERMKEINLYNIRQERARAEELIANSKVGTGIWDVGQVITTHLGNYENVLEYLGGEELRKKYTLLNEEMAYTQGVKKKQDKMFKAISEVYDGNKKKALKQFDDWSKELITLHISKPDQQQIPTGSTLELKEDFESLRLKIRRELETLPNTESMIDILDNMSPSRYRLGNKKNYNYKISNGEASNLQAIIQYLGQQDINENIEDINKNIVSFGEKEYAPLKDYKIDTWGLMYYDLLKRNKETKKDLEKYYSGDIETLENLLKQQPKEFFEVEQILFDSVQDWEELNPYYVAEFNRDLGRVDNYFDRRSFHEEDISIFDMLTTTDKEKTITAVQSRTKNAIPNLDYNPLFLALRHQVQTEYVKNIAPKLKNIIQIFSEENIRDLITQTKNQDTERALRLMLDNFKNNYINESDLEKIVGHLGGNWAKAKTNTLSVFFKQLTSFLPYMDGVNKTRFIINYLKGWAHPKETMKFMKDVSPYIDARFNNKEYKDFIDILKTDDEQKIIAWSKKWGNKLGKIFEPKGHTFTEFGDILSVIYGGYARYQTQIDNGMSHEEAIRDFERWTAETQQSNFKSLQSRASINQGMYGRFARMFMSQSSQYFQKNLHNYIGYFNGELSKAKLIKSLILYNVMTPLLLTLVEAFIIDNVFAKEDKDLEYWLKKYGGYVLTSFLPLGLIQQSVAVDILANFGKYKDALKNLETYGINALEILLGIPASSIIRLINNWGEKLGE